MTDSVLKDIKLHLVGDVEGAAAFMSWMGQVHHGPLAIDTETEGLVFHRDKVRLIQIGDADTGWAIPADRWGGVAQEAIKKWDGEWCLHNSKFDVNMLDYWDFLDSSWDWSRTHDTMALAHVIDPLRPKGLKALSTRLVDGTANMMQQWLDKGMHDNGWTWKTVPIDFKPYWLYAALDPVLTRRCLDNLQPRLSENSRHAYDLELGANAVVTRMERRGAFIDVPYCVEMLDKLKTYSARARAYIFETFGIENPGSQHQLLKGFARLGVTPTVTTETGNESANKYQLTLWTRDEFPEPVRVLAKTVLALRQAEKRADSYLQNFLDDVDPNGYVHPSIWQSGTKTSRMSITDPALQTLPRGDSIVRDAFSSCYGDENGRVITCDYSQIEARLMAHFARDEGLRNAFMSEEDFFVNLARDIFSDPNLTKDDPRRQLTKNTVYGKCYGAGIDKMAQTAGVPFDVMEPVVKEFDRKYPGVRSVQKQIERAAGRRYMEEGRPYVITPFGREIPCSPDKMYTLTNYLIQGHAAEILKRKLVEMDQVGLGEYLVLPVHDEAILDVPKDMADEVVVTLQSTMQDLTTYYVPLTVEAEVLDRWGTKYNKPRLKEWKARAA
jgi:DNA polymerase-1